jgi:hypothetical protein
MEKNTPNDHKIYQTVYQIITKYTKIFDSKAFQIIINWIFLQQNIPSGNPGRQKGSLQNDPKMGMAALRFSIHDGKSQLTCSTSGFRCSRSRPKNRQK